MAKTISELVYRLRLKTARALNDLARWVAPPKWKDAYNDLGQSVWAHRLDDVKPDIL